MREKYVVLKDDAPYHLYPFPLKILDLLMSEHMLTNYFPVIAIRVLVVLSSPLFLHVVIYRVPLVVWILFLVAVDDSF